MGRCKTCIKGCDSTCRQPDLWEQGREMTAIETFYQYHHCDKPTPASEKPNPFGGIRCTECGFDVMVVSWLGGIEEKNDNPS